MSEPYQNIQSNPKLSDSTGKKSLLEEYAESLESESNKLPDDAQAILEVLESDEQFNKEIEELMSAIEAGELDLTELQSKFLLLIKSTLAKLNKGELSKALEHLLKANEQDILDQLTTLSHHMMMQRAVLEEESLAIDDPKDKYSNLTAAAMKNAKKMFTQFAIYEIYKVMNPRRIAGESNRDNLIANFITGGIRKAMKYEPKEFKKTSAKEVKRLTKAHRAFKKTGGRGL